MIICKSILRACSLLFFPGGLSTGVCHLGVSRRPWRAIHGPVRVYKWYYPNQPRGPPLGEPLSRTKEYYLSLSARPDEGEEPLGGEAGAGRSPSWGMGVLGTFFSRSADLSAGVTMLRS